MHIDLHMKAQQKHSQGPQHTFFFCSLPRERVAKIRGATGLARERIAKEFMGIFSISMYV